MNPESRPVCAECMYYRKIEQGISPQCGNKSARGDADTSAQRKDGKIVAFLTGRCGRDGSKFVPWRKG